jgi:hypothetical protein
MPRKILTHYGLIVGIVEGGVQQALQAVATGGDLSFMAKQGFRCGGPGSREDRNCCS